MAQTAAEMIIAGRNWVARNRDSWRTLKAWVEADSAATERPLRISGYVERLRANGVSVPNNAFAYLSRRLARETGAEFTTAPSKVDEEMAEQD